jgi:pilus assembly protein Flp/PilA
MTALVVYLQNTVARLREREEGQTMAEYALIIGGIAIVVIAGILILGPAIRDLFQETGSSVDNFPAGS